MQTPRLSEDPALREMIREAAEEGAMEALRRVGLHDETAVDDVRELRGLLKACRDARSTIWQTMVRLGTTAVLAALFAGAGLLFWKDRP